MQLVFEQLVACDRDRLWRFHNDPDNLAHLLADWKSFAMVSHAGHVSPGARLVVSERLLGRPVELTFVHDLHEPPVDGDPNRPARFGEHAVGGPFARYEHVHEFVALAPDELVAGIGGGTRLIDRLDVQLRPAWGGELVTRLVVGPRLRRCFACRHRALARLVAAGAVP